MVKEKLKRNRLFYAVNARIKAQAVKRQYRKTVRFYAKKPMPASLEKVQTIRSKEKIQTIRDLDRAVNIFFLGTDELQDRSGILQALEKHGDLTYFTQESGSYGQRHPGPIPKKRETNSNRLLDLFASLSRQGKTPDILLGQIRASSIYPHVLESICRQYDPIVINISMDDRHQYHGKRVDGEWTGVYPLIPYMDLALTAAPECVDWYLKEACPALFFPEASDPEIFYPMPDLPKIHDVCFAGGAYGIRKKIVTALRKNGVAVTAYGTGWANGRIPTEEVPALFAQSRIILGIGTIGHCTDFYSLKLRDFDAPMSGSLYLTHYNPDLETLFEIGRETETYRTVGECVEKVLYYLNHPDQADAIGHAGRLRAENEHTWEKRFAGLFQYLEEV